ncbi:MAG: NAD-dependent epimerase/dehydratase family protein [Deltaproteobacteria bacterium]|nr:NAD-dependent epimerase/dehydratase family protein [Deltaproteobacteria bacterium]
MRICVTGAAGFIGAALSERLLKKGHEIVGIDNLNDYYSPELKKARLKRLEEAVIPGLTRDPVLDPGSGGGVTWRFQKIDLSDRSSMEKFFGENQFDIVVNLAAQAGVRHSVTHPHDYINSNLVGFLNVLEGCRRSSVKHLVYASTSSVYGTSKNYPFSESNPADTPISLYAATKRSNELMAHAYQHLYSFKTTGVRFFTVYGPWGRPDMALYRFTQNIFEEKPIDVYNQGYMVRNFTYIDDVVEGLVRLIQKPAENFRVLNLGNPQSTPLMDYITEIEKNIGKKAILNLLPMQPGDVAQNPADTHRMAEETGFVPQTSIQTGIKNFVDWYRDYSLSPRA